MPKSLQFEVLHDEYKGPHGCCASNNHKHALHISLHKGEISAITKVNASLQLKYEKECTGMSLPQSTMQHPALA